MVGPLPGVGAQVEAVDGVGSVLRAFGSEQHRRERVRRSWPRLLRVAERLAHPAEIKMQRGGNIASTQMVGMKAANLDSKLLGIMRAVLLGALVVVG